MQMMAESATRPHCAILWRARRVRGPTPLRSVRRTVCSRPTPRTMGLIRRRAACFSTLFTPILRWSSEGARAAAAGLSSRARRADRLAKAARAKYALLRRLFDDFAASELARETRLHGLRDFVREGGERLREHALFEALHQHWFARRSRNGVGGSGRKTGGRLAAPASAASPTPQHARIQFHMFLQWIAARSFSAVQQAARVAGMRIGLIADLAVGMNPGGSHAWSRQQDLLPGLSIGAPPDLFNARGQDWGLTASRRSALVASGFEPFLATLRAAMRHAGGVRIDHVMGWAGCGSCRAAPRHGGRLSRLPARRPAAAARARIASPSGDRHRRRPGHREPAFRERMSRAGVAGMDVLRFQREEQPFFHPPSGAATRSR